MKLDWVVFPVFPMLQTDWELAKSPVFFNIAMSRSKQLASLYKDKTGFLCNGTCNMIVSGVTTTKDILSNEQLSPRTYHCRGRNKHMLKLSGSSFAYFRPVSCTNTLVTVLTRAVYVLPTVYGFLCLFLLLFFFLCIHMLAVLCL